MSFSFWNKVWTFQQSFYALPPICSCTQNPSAMVKRWVSGLQLFVIKYKKGTVNPADVLSRLSIRSKIVIWCYQGICELHHRNKVSVHRYWQNPTWNSNGRHIKFGNKNSWKQQLPKEFTKFTSLLKHFARILCAKQHSFKEQQNCSIKSVVQKSSITRELRKRNITYLNPSGGPRWIMMLKIWQKHAHCVKQ